jgi:hypothetical protein
MHWTQDVIKIARSSICPHAANGENEGFNIEEQSPASK